MHTQKRSYCGVKGIDSEEERNSGNYENEVWHTDDIEEDNWDVKKDQNVFHQIKQFFGIEWEKMNMPIIGNLIISNHKDLYKTACFYFLNIFLWFWLRQSAFR